MQLLFFSFQVFQNHKTLQKNTSKLENIKILMIKEGVEILGCFTNKCFSRRRLPLILSTQQLQLDSTVWLTSLVLILTLLQLVKTVLKSPKICGFIEKPLDANPTITPLNTPFSIGFNVFENVNNKLSTIKIF